MNGQDAITKKSNDPFDGLVSMSTKRGRPRKASTLTNAQRQAKYRRCRVSLVVGDRMSGTVLQLASDFDLTPSEVLQHLVRFALCNKNWAQQGFPTK